MRLAVKSVHWLTGDPPGFGTHEWNALYHSQTLRDTVPGHLKTLNSLDRDGTDSAERGARRARAGPRCGRA